MKTKTIFFYILVVIYSLFIILLFLKVIPITIDKYSLVLLFGFIGISLLPFVDKLKIENVLEINRLKNKIEEVKLKQYLGEVIKTNSWDIYIFDEDGKHKLPNQQTASFLRSSKGEILVSKSDLHLMKSSNPIESVLNANIINWHGHIFVLLNNKKYHVPSWGYIADWGKVPNDAKPIDDLQIRLYPTAR